jgi:hypothetical protein
MRQAGFTYGAQQRLQDATRFTLHLHTCDVIICMTCKHIWILPYAYHNNATRYSQTKLSQSSY